MRPKLRLEERRIRIGIGAPLTGESAPMGTEMKQAIEMAIEEANVAGGILGATITASVCDDNSDARGVASRVDTLCSQPDLLGVVGHYNSDVSIAASNIYSACDLAMITPIASNPELTDRMLPNVFRFTNRDDRTGSAIAEYLYTYLGKRRAVVIESRSAYGKSMARWFVEGFSKLGGEIVSRQTVDVGARDFRSLVAGLPKDFDLLFYGGTFEGAFILKAMRGARMNQRFAAGDGCWDVKHFLEPAGPAATQGEGVLVLAATPAIGSVVGSSDFAERYRTRHGPMINYAVNSYDSARVLVRAIESAANNLDRFPARADVVHAMRKLRFTGIAYPNPTEWDSKGDNNAAMTALYEVTTDGFRQVHGEP
jgi:branched-chain amino acid transport system substrate-binding protein